MILLNSLYLAEYKAQLPKPVEGTCSWILRHPTYKNWLTAKETGLLWIIGDPGCGKTMLSAYLADNLRLARATPLQPQVFFFFCDDKIKFQRDASAILRGILYQILQHHRKLVKHVKIRFELDGPSLATSFPALWELFLKIVAELASGAVGIIVDAIDECEVRTRNNFLDAMIQLVHEAKSIDQEPRNWIKFLITSRPSLINSYNLTGSMENRLFIHQNQLEVSGDLKLVIRSKVSEITNKFHCDDQTKSHLEQVLYEKSGQSFLWLNMVLRSLEKSSRASRRDFERIINTFPPNLEATYSRFLHGISPEDREDARNILRLLVGGLRHLTLTEMNVAFTVDQAHRSIADVIGDLQLSIRSTLQNIVGPFVRIQEVNESSDPKVSLIHQSAKDYLTDLACQSTDDVVQRLAIPSADASLRISQSCIQYLLMDEFQTDIFASTRSSLETNSTHSSTLITFDTLGLGSSLDLDDHLGLDDFFKSPREANEEQCTSICQEFTFFDYSAMHWAEHYSSCEYIAPGSLREAVYRLTMNPSYVLTNWLRYFWFKTNMEYSFPEKFETIEVAAFFNLGILLAEILEKPGSSSEELKTRALFWAARMSSLDCIKRLLQHGANSNGVGIDRQTPLTISAQYGHLDAVHILLDDQSIDVTLRAKSGRSALSFAAGSGHLEIVRALLDCGAFRPDDQDNTRWTPLFWAVHGDYTGIVRLLLKQPSVDINQVDRSGRSVLSWAAGEGALRTLKVLLRSSTVDLNLKDAKGRSPLSWAAGYGQTEVIMILLRGTGIDKDTKDNDQRNAISWACQGGHIDTLRILLNNECGGEDDVDVDTWTPLLWALFIRSPATVEALLSTNRVQINRQDGYGRTALIWAASYGYLDVVQLLVSWKADRTIQNRAGHTAADVARMEGQTEICDFLEAQGDLEATRTLSDNQTAH